MVSIAASITVQAAAEEIEAGSNVPALARPDGYPNPADRVRRVTIEQLDLGGRPLFYAEPSDATAPPRPLRSRSYEATQTDCRPRPALTLLSLRQRLVNLAVAEWAAFGFPVFDVSANSRYLVPQSPQSRMPNRLRIIPPALNVSMAGFISQRALRLGYAEDDIEMRDTIAGYWSSLPIASAQYMIQALIWRSYGNAGWATPWSAAFISWLACESGLAEHNFRKHDYHMAYIDQAIDGRDGVPANEQSGPYRAYDLWEYLPQPGDLICRARDSSSYDSIASRRQDRDDTPTAPAHCDIVVNASRSDRRVYAIGGNVLNAVTLTIANLVTDKRAPSGLRLQNAGDMKGAAAWFAILKLDAGIGGSKAALERAPTIADLGRRVRDYATALDAQQ